MARQARSLDVLVDEVNALSPDRSKISDGGLGDAAHSSRESDHNPNSAGVWRARDFTDDDVDDDEDGGQFGDVFDCDWLAGQLVAMYHAPDVHPAMRSGAYTIFKGRIYSYDRRDEGWRPYSGANSHSHHVHQSVATAVAGYDSTEPWLTTTEDDDMKPEDFDRIRAIVREEVDTVLDTPLNIREPGDKRFSGMSVRALLKRVAVKTGAVK